MPTSAKCKTIQDTGTRLTVIGRLLKKLRTGIANLKSKKDAVADKAKALLYLMGIGAVAGLGVAFGSLPIVLVIFFFVH